MKQDGVCYEIRVQGHLGGHWTAWFPGMTLTHHDDGTTGIIGPVADQAELHGLLARVRDLGAPLVSVTPRDRLGSGRGPAAPEQRDCIPSAGADERRPEAAAE